MRKVGDASLVVFLLLSSLVLPSIFVGADGSGGALISVESVEILGDGDLGVGDVSVNFSLVEILGNEINCTYSVTLSDLDGNELENKSLEVNLQATSESNQTQTFTAVNPGIYFLKILVLQGFAPSNSESELFVKSRNFTIQRLNPQSISVPPVAQWDVEILNGNLQPANNETPNDGDTLEINILISNTGDINWTGNWRYLHLNPDSSIVEQSSALTVNKTSTTEVFFTLPIVKEGIHIVNFSILDSSDDTSFDDYRIYEFDVGPPPLANLSVNLTSVNAESAQIGSLVLWNISIINSGLKDYMGVLKCYDRSFSNTVFEEQVTVEIGETLYRDMSLSAAPGIVGCEVHSNQRIDLESSNYTQYEFDFDAAEFVIAGQSGISVLGGPWYSGDTITFSIIILNEGNYSGTASLRLSAGNVVEDGSIINIGTGSSTELFSSITLSQLGKNVVSWSIQSQDGYVSSNLSGEMEIYVLPSQWLNVSITSVDLKSASIELDWSVELSEGHSRPVMVEIGYDNLDGDEVKLLEFEVEVEPGMRNYETVFDKIESSDYFWINLQPIGWLSSGNLGDSKTTPDALSLPSISLSSKTTPSRPMSGEGVELEYTISNTGQLNTGIGTLYLLDTNDMILWSKELTEIDPGSSRVGKITISSWPDGAIVDLRLIWKVDGSEIIELETFLSGSASGETESLTGSIPWMNLVIGVVIAVVVILLTRVANTWSNSSGKTKFTSYSRKKDDKKITSSTKQNESDKKEVVCNSCGQKLNVPVDYSGQVRCPACKHQFDVESDDGFVETDVPKPVTKQEMLETNEMAEVGEEKSKEMVSSSSTDIVKCPDCESKLRVPLEKRPVKARCPGCKVEFRALKD